METVKKKQEELNVQLTRLVEGLGRLEGFFYGKPVKHLQGNVRERERDLLEEVYGLQGESKAIADDIERILSRLEQKVKEQKI